MRPLLQTIRLTSPFHYGRKVPPEAIGKVLKAVPNAVRGAIRMSLEGCSRARGKRPEWLKAAADIRFVGHDGDDQTVLHFEAPRLGEAAAKVYEQGELWATRPEPADTGFDVLADVITEVAKRNEDSQKFDKPLLNQVARFRPLLTGAFTEMALTSRRYTATDAAVLTPEIVEIARSFSVEIPQPRRARVTGKLDMLRPSTQAFALILCDGQEVPGVFVPGDVGALAPLFQKDVLVVGRAIYRPSGRLLRIDADAVSPAESKDFLFSRVPEPRRAKFNLHDLHERQAHKKGLAAIYGKWPGDESDEEIERALKELG